MTETYRQKPPWFLKQVPTKLLKTILLDRVTINLNFNS